MQVFISYASEDKELATKISRLLESVGLRVWLDESHIMPADNWAERISQALKESRAMVVLVSPAAVNSERVRREIEFALGAKEYSGRLLPVFVGPRERIPRDRLPWILLRLEGIELTDQAEEKGLQQIVHALSKTN